MTLAFVIWVLSLVSPLTDSLNLCLLNDEIRVKSEQVLVSLKVKLVNNSDDNLLLYNFNGPTDLAFKDESFFCNDQMSARCTIVIYDDSLNAVFASIPGIPKEIDYKSISDEKFQDVVTAEQVNFRKALQVIKKGSYLDVEKVVSIKYFKLVPGTYFMRLIFTSGASNINMVDHDTVVADEMDNSAKMFSGCLKSNVIKLIVK